MPLHYLRRMTGPDRTQIANRHLARYLSFVAGAVNAGGFLAVRQYTSHMTGIVSAMADNLAIGSMRAVAMGMVSVASFVLGAFCTSSTIRLARRRGLQSQYALPLVLEAALLIVFGLVGREFRGHVAVTTMMLLCFTMGLQNATITKISGAVIRTTHLTGMLTDIGIEFGRMAFASSSEGVLPASDPQKLRLLSSLVTLFFLGGVTGALGFHYLGFLFTMPLAAILILLAAMPLLDDLRKHPQDEIEPPAAAPTTSLDTKR
jgi:uncharacterized membrane protein YoaK (UPF0700 family)